jgi:hypothetical protein
MGEILLMELQKNLQKKWGLRIGNVVPIMAAGG